MILWHIGLTFLIARYIFRDPEMDLRWVAVGSLLPDIIDKPIGSIFFHDTFGTHRVFAHTLLLPLVAVGVILVATRRGSVVRRSLLYVSLGWFAHLLLDGVVVDYEQLLWPFFGTEFPFHSDSAFLDLLRRMVTDWRTWAGEAIGASYLVFLWLRRLDTKELRRDFVRTGRIPFLQS
jgi:inner membrane protein